MIACHRCGVDITFERPGMRNPLGDGRFACRTCYNPPPPPCANGRPDHAWGAPRITENGTRYRTCTECGMVSVSDVVAEVGTVYRKSEQDIPLLERIRDVMHDSDSGRLRTMRELSAVSGECGCMIECNRVRCDGEFDCGHDICGLPSTHWARADDSWAEACDYWGQWCDRHGLLGEGISAVVVNGKLLAPGEETHGKEQDR